MKTGIVYDQSKLCVIILPSVFLTNDVDGLDIHFLNSEERLQDCTSSETIQDLFEEIVPAGTTPLGNRLHDLLDPYVSSIERYVDRRSNSRPKRMILVVITDGEPDDQELVKQVLISAASRLDRVRWPNIGLGVQFVQVGTDLLFPSRFLIQFGPDWKRPQGYQIP
jgi:hypothetical protein